MKNEPFEMCMLFDFYGDILTDKQKEVRDVQMYKVFQDAEFRKQKKISPFETVSRARRELQNDFIHLRSDEKIEQARKAREEIFENYYGKGR